MATDPRGRVNRFRAVLFATATLLSAGSAAAQDLPPVTVRVLTYNIHHGEGMDRVFDLHRLAEIMKATDPDLVALQEVDQGTQRAGGTMQLDELGKLMGMHSAFGPAMAFQGGEYGVGVLSRWPLLDVRNRPLPTPPSYLEPRTLLTVETRVGEHGPILRFSSTHLENSREAPEERVAQAAEVNRLLAQDARPSVLGGDFNARAEPEIVGVLSREWTNAATLVPFADSTRQARRGGARSDFILFRPAGSWRVVEWEVIDAPVASDHRPVLAVLEWVGDS